MKHVLLLLCCGFWGTLTAGEIVLKAVETFHPVDEPGLAPYYEETRRLTPENHGFAINTVKHFGAWSAAETTFEGPDGTYDIILHAVTEEDGQSSYQLHINGRHHGSRHNPPTEAKRSEVVHLFRNISLEKGDVIRIVFRGASNGLIPEGDGFAWARGRWKGITLIPAEETKPQKEQLVGIWGIYECTIENLTPYPDPFRDVSLDTVFTRPDGTQVRFFGFHDSPGQWKFRCMPDQLGKWMYRATFSDGSGSTSGTFTVIEHKRRGVIRPNPDSTQGWIDGTGNPVVLRSLHVGDRFFAANWPNKERKAFIEWVEEAGYDTLSIASFFLNRDKDGRGAGWDTPDLWDAERALPNPDAYAQAEEILNTLSQKSLYVFPFAGFLGRDSDFPRSIGDLQLYMKYTIARFAPYYNFLFNVGGPEPLMPNKPFQTVEDIDDAGNFIANLIPFGHPLTVHNPTNKNLSQGCDWISYVTLQGPKTTDMVELHQKTEALGGPDLPVYSQETIWPGNSLHPERSPQDVRRGIVVLGFSGAHTNIGDMDGNSSSGFSGNLQLDAVHPEMHEAAHDAWNFLDSLPQKELVIDHAQPWPMVHDTYHQYHYIPVNNDSTPIVSAGSSAKTGEFRLHWIMDEDLWSWTDGGTVRTGDALVPPNPETSWIAALTRTDVVNDQGIDPTIVAKGSYPDLVVDGSNNIHLVYAREGGLYYRTFKAGESALSTEEDTGIRYEGTMADGPHRGDPEIVLDLNGQPHVIVGRHYAWKEHKTWKQAEAPFNRDHALAIDPAGNMMAVNRSGNHDGQIGAFFMKSGSREWESCPRDPDTGTEAGIEWKGSGDHTYGHVFAGPDGRFHVVYRHGKPDKIAYRYTDDLGKTWHGGGVFGKTAWQPESAHGGVDRKGTVWVAGPNGGLYRKSGDPSEFEYVGRPLLAGGRTNPDLAFDKDNNLYSAAFGGECNVRDAKGRLRGRRLLPRLAPEKIGFVSLASSNEGNFVYAVYEQGNLVHKEHLSGTSAIILTTLSEKGTVGKSR